MKHKSDTEAFKIAHARLTCLCFKKRECIFVSSREGDGLTDELHSTKTNLIYKVFSHDVTAAILVSQNNETAAILVSQTSPVGVELFYDINAFFCSNKFA